MRHTAPLCVRFCATELFVRDLFVRNGLYHIGSGHEHVRRALDHEDEVCKGGRVDGTAGAWAQNDADLRHHAAGHGVAQEDVGIAAQGDHTFLDAGTTGIIQADHGSTDLQRVVEQLDDLLGVHFAQRATKDRKVLRKHTDRASMDRSEPCDHAITKGALFLQTEPRGPVARQHIQFGERTGVEQHVDALTCRELPFCVLCVDPCLAAAELCFGFEVT